MLAAMADVYETTAERRIREAMEQGEFDDLPGEGAPIAGLDTTYDPGWWARTWLERQRSLDHVHDTAAATERALGAVWLLPDEDSVRRRVEELNQRLVAANERVGARDRADLLDPDGIVGTWRRMSRAAP